MYELDWRAADIDNINRAPVDGHLVQIGRINDLVVHAPQPRQVATRHRIAGTFQVLGCDITVDVEITSYRQSR